MLRAVALALRRLMLRAVALALRRLMLRAVALALRRLMLRAVALALRRLMLRAVALALRPSPGWIRAAAQNAADLPCKDAAGCGTHPSRDQSPRSCRHT